MATSTTTAPEALASDPLAAKHQRTDECITLELFERAAAGDVAGCLLLRRKKSPNDLNDSKHSERLPLSD